MAARIRQVVWAQSARKALDEALVFIAEDSLSGARSVLHATLDLADSLSTLGERGRVVPELNDPEIREVFVYSYRLIYRLKSDQVLILAFLHGARDFERWRRRKV